MNKPIVIVGGMGPQASAHLHQLLLEKSCKFHNGDGDGFPSIVHISLSVPDFISDPEARATARGELEALVPLIKQFDPYSVLLACNTAHLLVPEVPALQELPLISLLETMANRIQESGIRRIGVLASPSTVRTQLYEKLLKERGIHPLLPDSTEQQVVERAIRRVIAMKDVELAVPQLGVIANKMVANGADAILLGCTELPLAFDATQCGVPVFDCLDIYATTVIKQHYLYNGV